MKEYRYELHAHTSETSACGQLGAADLVNAYADRGYHGLMVADHMVATFTSGYKSWHECVEAFWAGFRAARAQGARRGLAVLPGMELAFDGQENRHFLVIGLEEAELHDMPFPHRLGLEEFYRRYGGHLLIVQAHPFRTNSTPAAARFLHGVEGINSHSTHSNHNEMAMEFFHNNPHLLCTCGSDTHCRQDVAGTAVVLGHPAATASALRQALLRGAYRMESERFGALVPASPARKRVG